MITQISSSRQNTTFGEALSTRKLKTFNSVAKKAQNAINQKLGIQKEQNIFIIPDFSLPEAADKNTGMGRLFSDTTESVVKLIKNYFNPTDIEVLPQNTIQRMWIPKKTPQNFPPDHVFDHYFSPYSANAMTLGEHNINLFALTEKKYGNLLQKDELKNIVDSNTHKNLANPENEIGTRTIPNPRAKILEKAYERFLKQDTPELKEMKKNFDAYKQDPFEERRMEKISLYEVLGNSHKDLFDIRKTSLNEREKIIAKAKQDYAREIDLFKFKQFLADEHHKEGKKIINGQGIGLIGDMHIGSLDSDKWANPIGLSDPHEHGMPALNFKHMFNDNGSLGPAGEHLRDKLTFFLKRYDSIRIDCGYKFFEKQQAADPKKPTRVLELIDQVVESVKGPGFDKSKILFEFTDQPHKTLVGLGNHTVVKTVQSPDSIPKNLKEVITGIANHDNQSAITQAKERVKNHPFYHYDIIPIENYKDIVKVKFGEIFATPRKLIFMDDFFGVEEKFNFENGNNVKSFRHRLSPDFEKDYHRALQNGDGFNIMEAYGIAMKKLGIDKTDPKLFEEVSEQGALLRKKGALTQKEADLNETPTPVNKDKNKKWIAVAGILLAATGVYVPPKQTKRQFQSEPLSLYNTKDNPYEFMQRQQTTNPFAVKGFL